MKTLHINLVKCLSRQSIKTLAVLVALPLLSSLSHAADSCGSGGCLPGCGEGMLTGPTNGSVYQPTEPPLQDNSSDFIQQPTPNEPASSNTTPQDNSAPFNQPQASAASPSLFSGGVEGTLTAQGAAQGHAPGYIDWAVPRSIFRLRFDAGFNNERPDRAEFFYAQCGCAGGPGPGGPPGPNGVLNGSVNYQDLRGYLEIAQGRRFSVFGEVPVRFLQTSASAGPAPGRSPDAAGISDLEAGFKYALIREANSTFTFQLKTYIPTGNASQGLGTNHVSLEPGFLAQQKVNRDLTVFGELRDWIPVNGSTGPNGSNFAGNVLRYGVGTAYTVADTCRYQVSPVVECVGWSVLDGQVFNPNTGAAESAATTIVNMKLGVRTMFKSNGSTLYLGYGHALTGTSWYQDIARVEYTIYL